MLSLRYIWLALFVFFIGMASYLLEELIFSEKKNLSLRSGSLELQVQTDFQNLKQKKLLPESFKDIHQIFINDYRTAKFPIDWEQLSKREFNQKKEGIYDLQIMIFDESEGFDLQTEILQFSLFERSTKNKVWELSRSYQQPLK